MPRRLGSVKAFLVFHRRESHHVHIWPCIYFLGLPILSFDLLLTINNIVQPDVILHNLVVRASSMTLVQRRSTNDQSVPFNMQETQKPRKVVDRTQKKNNDSKAKQNSNQQNQKQEKEIHDATEEGSVRSSSEDEEVSLLTGTARSSD